MENNRHHPGETTRQDASLRAFLFFLAVASPLVSPGFVSSFSLSVFGLALSGAVVKAAFLTSEVVVNSWLTKNRTK